jgi:hypothetical protein
MIMSTLNGLRAMMTGSVKAAVGTVLAALLALGFATPATAGSATNGVLTITAADRALQPACYDYQNMTYSVTGGNSWSLKVDVYKSTGIGDFDYATGDAAGSGLLSAYLCATLDGPGTYTVRAVLTSYDSNFNALPNVEAYTTFELSAPAPVVPPVVPAPVVPAPVVPAPVVPAPVVPAPVAKATTKTGIAAVSKSGDTIKTLQRGKAAFVGTRVLRGSTWLNGARVTLQSHPAGRPWASVATRRTATMAGTKGMAIVKVKPRVTTYYRWVLASTGTSKASHSATAKIKVSRG